jgi:hypothetical protein
LTAANHLKKVDLKLKEILTDEAIDEFQSRVIKAGNAFPFK